MLVRSVLSVFYVFFMLSVVQDLVRSSRRSTTSAPSPVRHRIASTSCGERNEAERIANPDHSHRQPAASQASGGPAVANESRRGGGPGCARASRHGGDAPR